MTRHAKTAIFDLARFLNGSFDIVDFWFVGVIGCAESNGVVIIHVTRHRDASRVTRHAETGHYLT